MPTAGSADKCSIIATIITLNRDFLLMQLIYVGKTIQTFARFKFPDSFSLSVNPSHFSNTTISIKVIEEIVVPYVEEQRRLLQLPNQAVLITKEVFRGQMTAEALDILRAHKIYLCKAPTNMTHLLQPLNLTVYNHCKVFIKKLVS